MLAPGREREREREKGDNKTATFGDLNVNKHSNSNCFLLFAIIGAVCKWLIKVQDVYYAYSQEHIQQYFIVLYIDTVMSKTITRLC